MQVGAIVKLNLALTRGDTKAQREAPGSLRTGERWGGVEQSQLTHSSRLTRDVITGTRQI